MSLTGVRLKIKRAQEHINALHSAIRAVHKADPYVVVREIDEDAQYVRWRVQYAPGFVLPDDLRLLAGDAAHNLRSALDHLACAAVTANGRPITSKTDFPIWRPPTVPSAKDLKALARRKVAGARQDVIDLIGTFQSYPGGNQQVLWELDHLDIIDKHQTLLLAVSSHESVILDFGAHFQRMFPAHHFGESVPSMELGIRPADRCPMKDGDELLSVPLADADKWDEPKFAVHVAFGDPGVLQCEPVVPKLTQLVQVVTGLVDSFEPLLT